MIIIESRLFLVFGWTDGWREAVVIGNRMSRKSHVPDTANGEIKFPFSILSFFWNPDGTSTASGHIKRLSQPDPWFSANNHPFLSLSPFSLL